MDLFAGQPAFFDQQVCALAEDAEGGIRYHPHVVPASVAQDWFLALRDAIAWQSLRRPMYERVVDVPRLVASYALADPMLPPALLAAREAVATVTDRPFDSVGLNLYRDGNDSVAPHNDRLHDLVEGQPIALLSLGHARDMVIRPKPGMAGRPIRIPLAPGSVLVMSHASQSTHDHGVPKTRHPVGARISLAFRVRGARRS